MLGQVPFANGPAWISGGICVAALFVLPKASFSSWQHYQKVIAFLGPRAVFKNSSPLDQSNYLPRFFDEIIGTVPRVSPKLLKAISFFDYRIRNAVQGSLPPEAMI